MISKIISKILLTLALAGAAVAQVTVNGPIQTGMDGGTFTGKVVIERAAITNGGVYYGGYRKEISVSGGVLSVSLAPNVGSLPAGTSYKVTYYPQPGFGSTGNYTRYWIVPASGPTTIAAIEVALPPTPSSSIAASQLTGLVALANGGTNNGTWTASRCVQVSSDGTKLESAAAACGGGGGGGVADPGANGIMKRTALNVTAPAVAGTDYAVATNGTNGQALTSNGAGGFGTPVTLAASATTDATNATNIGSGTLAATRLPATAVRTDQANTYTSGQKQTVAPSTTTAGLNVGTATTAPSSPATGDLFFNTTNSRPGFYDGTNWRYGLYAPLSGTGPLVWNGTTMSASAPLSLANGGTNATSLASGFVRSSGTALSGGNSVPVAVQLTSSTGVSASSTQFFGNAGLAPSATETTRQVPAPRSGSVTEMYCTTSGANGASGAYVMTLRVNAASTAVVVTVPISGAQGTYSSTGNNVSVTAGDRLTVQGNNSLTAATAPVAACQVVIMATQ